jgi:hypothetical protein
VNLAANSAVYTTFAASLRNPGDAVASHFSSVGFPLRSEADLYELADRIGEHAEPLATDRGTYFRWSDPSGAEVWLQANTDNEGVGMNPHFVGKSTVRVRLTARPDPHSPSPLDGRFHGWADPSDSEEPSGAYPFLFDAPDAGCHDELELPTTVVVQIAAFAHEISAFDSPEAYMASQTHEVKFASQSFIPSGLFNLEGDDRPPRAEAIFAGHVRESERRTNRLTGKDFFWCLVDTLGGSFDVVIDPELLTDLPKVGGVIHGSFWLSGRILR